VGKTALLDYLAEQASGCQVVRAAGVQSEMELAFAGLHQLCAPLLERTDRLPVPQRDALRIAFGLSSGPAPERFLVGLAVLGLVSDVAGERPLLCVVDDVQWLDRTSSQVLGFVARRLGADPVGLVFAARVPGDDVAGLPELAVEGLGPSDARALLDSVLTGPLDARVRDQIVAEMRGNPLALLELPRGLSPTELAGGFGLPGVVPLSGRIEQSFRGQIDLLPASARRLLVLAAADPSGDPLLVRRAAERLGLPADAGGPAADAGLVEFSPRVRFRHPLTRSAAYRSATTQERGQAHAALAEATDQALDPDRRAWHRAAAALVPDEDVAAELERCADRAQARGGLAAAAAFLERAMTLTPEPAGRAGRALAAAQANLRAGAFDKARDLLATAEAGPLDDFYDAQADLLRGQLAFASGPGSDAPPLLLKAAKRLALAAALRASEHKHIYASSWAWPELIEAAVRTGDMGLAGETLDRLTETTKAGGTDLGLGIDARSRALLSEGEAAEDLYHEAISRLGRTRRRPDLARAHLLFGEWLRRERRRGEARGQLRTACHMLEAMGMEAFAERARRELAAAGEPMANRIAEAGRTSSGRASQQLTAQEAQVAQLARDGLSNPDIAARLFISTRTVQYHLGKVFAKLGIDSRGQLHRVLPGGPRR